jgi:uncharacterized repeat protein (TIGR03803 family)
MRLNRSDRSLAELRARLSQNVLKLLGLILTLLLILQLTSCGGSSNSSPNSPSEFSVGGAVSGLSGGSLALINNDTESLPISSDGPYKFTLRSQSGGTYAVDILTQPPGQVCTVTNGSGVVAHANVTNVDVACASSPLETIYAFAGDTDGVNPESGVTAGSDGNFYGTTVAGGANNLGTVYRITPAGVKTTIYSFAGGTGDGESPASGLDPGDDGAFYMTTTGGGTFGLGTFIRITLDGQETMLYSFGGNGSGAIPQGLTHLDGNFYGTTTAGGANNLGTIYEITPAGVQNVLYSFAPGTDGRNPQAGLSTDSDGNLYGVTYHGGTNDLGTIFRIAPDGTGYTSLYSFAGGTADGQYPGVKLRNVADGSLWGSTTSGGANGLGTIFRYDPGSAAPTIMHSFAGAPNDGENPSCRLHRGNDGDVNLYGVTLYGGYFNLGTFFSITPAGVLTVLHSFAGGAEGQGPDSSLLLSPQGDFYGTTVSGGPTNSGTVYTISP